MGIGRGIKMKTNSRTSSNITQKFTTIFSFASVFFISSLTAKSFVKFHTSKYNALVEAAHGVLSHKPHWLAYQNRLLAPYSVYGISLFGIPFEKALMVFYVLAIFAQTIILYVLLLKYTNNNFSLSILYVIFFSFMFIGIQHSWFYTWDSLEIIFFILFSWGIWRKKTTLYFVALFFIALTNKESAIFIAVFLIVDAFQFQNQEDSFFPAIKLSSVAKLVTGSCLTFFGVAYTKLVRDYLFIVSSKPDLGDDSSHRVLGNHLTLPENLQAFFSGNLLSTDIINSLFLIGLVVYLLWSFDRFEEQDYKAFIIIMLIIISIFLFGLINETRIYAPLLPFILFFHLRQHQEQIDHKTVA